MTVLRGQHERRLGVVELAGDLLHLRGAQSGRVGQDGQWVATEPGVGEHVAGQEGQAHRLSGPTGRAIMAETGAGNHEEGARVARSTRGIRFPWSDVLPEVGKHIDRRRSFATTRRRMTEAEPGIEFDRQVQAYVALGVPGLHGRTDAGFAEWVAVLRGTLPEPALKSVRHHEPGAPARPPALGDVLAATSRWTVAEPGPAPCAESDRVLAAGPAAAAGRLPFVLVVPGVPAEALMPLTRQGGHAGYVDMNPVGSEVFAPVAEARPPRTPYLAIDVDTGAKTLGVTPLDAGEQTRSGRSPPVDHR